MQTHPELNLVSYFPDLPEPRVLLTRHRLLDLLVIAVCTLLCGGAGGNDMEDFGCAQLPAQALGNLDASALGKMPDPLDRHFQPHPTRGTPAPLRHHFSGRSAMSPRSMSLGDASVI